MSPGQVSLPIRFGEDLELDPRVYELRRAGRRLKLERIPMEILMLLIEQRGELVTREQIRERIWGNDVFVDADTSINSAVRKMRQVLKDSPETPRFVQTITGRGYRFIAPVAEGPRPPIQAAAHPGSGVGEDRSDDSRALGDTAPAGIPGNLLGTPRRVKFWAVAAACLVLVLIAALAARPLLFPGAGPVPIRAIVVLPLENLTGDPGQQYFTDGMTDALITMLAQIRPLRVISRTSAMHYRDSRKSLREIARELGVDAVLEGSVSRAGGRVRINVQLIQASTDHHLWARSYDRDLQDVLTLQSELAQAIASEIQIQLTSEELANLAAKRPVNPQAYEAYLKGRFFWNKRSKEAIDTSIEFFNEAIRLDPGYAAAYAGLADAYNITACGTPAGMPVSEAAPKARAAARKALELDDKSAEVHTTLGMVESCFGSSLAAAEMEYRKAIALNPNYALAHHYYAVLLLGFRNQEGIRQVQEALKLDPVSPNINGLFGDFLFETRQFDKGIEQLQKTLALDPHQYNTRVRLGFAYAVLKRYAEAENEFQEAERISPGTLSSVGGLAYVYALEGQTARVEKLLPELESKAVKAGHPLAICLIYIGLHRNTEALRWLEKAYDEGDFSFDLENPLLDPLRSDPGFEKLNARAKAALPPTLR
jgi:TolB-like protein/DNA-binding winged helix-turn-helix (wHTH) protein/Flp pilus assembly protein TadD